jgi:hypothetical protein
MKLWLSGIAPEVSKNITKKKIGQEIAMGLWDQYALRIIVNKLHNYKKVREKIGVGFRAHCAV